jgi:hypothetical protein
MFKRAFSIFIYAALFASLGLLYASHKSPEVVYTVKSVFGMAPCQKPMGYAIGNFDERFEITEAEVLEILKEAEAIWENIAGKELFYHSPDAKMKIHFIYDERQAATDRLKALGLKIDSGTETYQYLKNELEKRKLEYAKNMEYLKTFVAQLNADRKKFESDASYWNKKGGAPSDVYEKLTRERERLQSLVEEGARLQNRLAIEVAEINAIVDALNQTAEVINVGVETYNRIGKAGGEFEEGIYRTSGLARQIEIYQFRDRTQLLRVLAHELGHALQMNHVEDPKSIMYELNHSPNTIPTADDILELQTACRLI